MQTRSSDENSVCPSVCPPVRQTRELWHKKEENHSRFLHRKKYHLT